MNQSILKAEVEKLKHKYNRVAPFYDILDFYFEYTRYRKIRKRCWSGLSGRILDPGVGTGRNIDFYPQEAVVTGIDTSQAMLLRAQRRANKNNRHVDLQLMNVLDMSFPDNYFDAVVATFLFCVLPDTLQEQALREIKRVCKPGGTIVVLEYTYSKHWTRKFWMKLLSPYVEALYGARFDRRTIEYVRKENFQIIEEAFVYKDIIKLIRLKKK